MSLHAIVDAHKNGFDENMYLDAATRTKVEETGGATSSSLPKDGKLSHRSPTVSFLLSSFLNLCCQGMGLEAEEREIYFISERFR